jgi:hypothetical protein
MTAMERFSDFDFHASSLPRGGRRWTPKTAITRRTKMEKTTYGFSARYQDVDFLRIVEENIESSFILVEWKNERRVEEKIILLTPAGFERCSAVDMEQGVHKNRCEIEPNGHRWENTNGPICKYVWWLNTNDFESWYAMLRQREERCRPIKVTAIV